jgi:subtilase family serine protease
VAAVVSVHPIPASAGHVLAAHFSSPPDDAICQADYGIDCYQPAQYQQAYDLKPLYARGITGKGRTIVIVDAFGSPTIKADLQHFDQTFGLPDPPHFNIIQPAGALSPYPDDPFGAADRSGWAYETTLDVEYSHIIAPGANILLVETPQSETEGVQGFPQIVEAENYVINHDLGDVITQSFGATEETFPSKQSILNLRSAFVNAAAHGVTVLASSGDDGSTNYNLAGGLYTTPVNSWPSADPLVTSVGGTQMHLDANGNHTAPDNVWNDFDVFGPNPGAGGGGASHVFARPAYQFGVHEPGHTRLTPDVSMSAAVDGGAVIYESFCDYSDLDPVTGDPACGPSWGIIGGTSEASPLFSGIVALADQLAGKRLGLINPDLYLMSGFGHSGIVDITSGTNAYTFCTANCGDSNEVDITVPGQAARPGYDTSSGVGTVNAAKFVPALAALGRFTWPPFH